MARQKEIITELKERGIDPTEAERTVAHSEGSARRFLLGSGFTRPGCVCQLQVLHRCPIRLTGRLEAL
jgi:hypothetical protein